MTQDRRGPDFLGVGPEKTGTTWINDQLAAHPQVWTHPAGEMCYFWEDWDSPGQTALRRFRDVGGWRHKHYRHYALRVAKRIVTRPSHLFGADGRLGRDLSYLFGRHDDEWYLGQFPAGQARLTGEISPQYFFLPDDQIAHIARLLPQCRIMVSLRDPVDWVWSFARMVMKNGEFGRYGTIENFVAHRFDANSFSGSIERWQKHFGTDRVKVLIYDTLRDDPWAYYTEICGFLGIEPDPARRALVSQRVNPGQSAPIEPEHAALIRRATHDDMVALQALGVAVPPDWFA